MLSGEDLKRYRQYAGFTQQQLGEMLGYTGRTAEVNVQHWENERREIPAKHYRKLSYLLNIPLDKLVP